MRIGFFTPRPIEPLHPRLLLFQRYFLNKGYTVSFVNGSDYRPGLYTRLNWLSLYYFDLIAINRCKARIAEFDIVFVTDLRYLPLVKYAKRAGKTVIYETIDHNVYLRFFLLQKKIRVVTLVRNPIVTLFKRIEKHYAFRYCDEILVNSEALADYFKGKAHILFYYSPFEHLEQPNDPRRPPALLYLGAFSEDKGARRIIDLSERLKMPLHVYGPIPEASVKEAVRQTSLVTHTPKVSAEVLEAELSRLLTQYYLFGCSLIEPVHLSYEIQEANKDIDYMAMGIPIIGNYRRTTAGKINAGCGIFFDDGGLSEKVGDPILREALSVKCKALYRSKYSSENFNRQMDAVMRKYLGNA